MSIVGVITAAATKIETRAILHFRIRRAGVKIPNLVNRKKKTGISKDIPKPPRIHNKKLKYLDTEIRGDITSI